MNSELSALKEVLPDPPAMGERRARWGYGYQDKVATNRILRILKDDLRAGAAVFEGIRLADLLAGRVDDFVLVWGREVEGTSVKWSGDAAPVNWGELIGAAGLLKELAEGRDRLRRVWTDRTARVGLHSNRPPSPEKHPSQLISSYSVAEFVSEHWNNGPQDDDPEPLQTAWQRIASAVGLEGAEFTDFVKHSRIVLNSPEPPGPGPDTREWAHYLRQFDALHKAIATWITNNPESEFIGREYLLDAIGFRGYRYGLVQRFPAPRVPYVQNASAAEQLRHLIETFDGGYVAVTGPAGSGKSTLVQDVLTGSDYPFFIPYYAFLPDGEGNPRDRGEALTFYQDVVGRLDKFYGHRYSLGITDVAHGREALRGHLQKAHEQFVIQGRKTVILIDGLDHVAREVDLRQSVLHDLPEPEEIPPGCIVVLSSQPQALEPGTIRASIADAVSAGSGRRVDVPALTRKEVHDIASKLAKATSPADRDRLYDAAAGNPLVVTYVVNVFERTSETTMDSAVAEAGEFAGDMDAYYARALSVTLRDGKDRHLLGLLCRAAPTIPLTWLESWPEHSDLEDLYGQALCAFVRVEDGSLLFLHNSLVSYLKVSTRPLMPGADHIAAERRYHSELADRCAGRTSSDPLGRAHIIHLLRSERYADLLQVLPPSWARNSVAAYVPFQLLKPLIEAGFEAAWQQGNLGRVVEYVLLSHELQQRSSRVDPRELAEAFLTLGMPEVAISLVRSGGRILVPDKDALAVAASLWFCGRARSAPSLQDAARKLYLQAKPLEFIFHGEPISERRHHDYYSILRAWSEAALLFEAPEAYISQVKALRFEFDLHDRGDERSTRSALLYAALQTAIEAELSATGINAILAALADEDVPNYRFAALHALSAGHARRTDPKELDEAFGRCSKTPDFALAYASHLYDRGEWDASRGILSQLKHIRFERVGEHHGLGYTDISFTVELQCLQTLVGVAAGPLPGAKDRHEEALARIEAASRNLGSLLALARAGKPVPNLEEQFRRILLFQHQRAHHAEYDRREGYVISTSKPGIHDQLVRVATAFGPAGFESLKGAILTVASARGPSHLIPAHRRFFAEELYRAGIFSNAEALGFGLAGGGEDEDEDPAERQAECLEVARFVRMMGNEPLSDEWVRRASEVSAGAGSHKDYHLENLAGWLDAAMEGAASALHLGAMEKLARAVQVAGGAGQTGAASQLLRTTMRTAPERAHELALEYLDRSVVNLHIALEALLVGGADAGASPYLTRSVYHELLALVAPESTDAAAVAILNSTQSEEQIAAAKRMMSYVRTNALPSSRMATARALQDALRSGGHHEVSLTGGLKPDRNDSSSQSLLYTLRSGEVRTMSEVAARLSDVSLPEEWNPNPGENGQFNWWSAVREAEIRDLEHLEMLLATAPLPDYRETELLAFKARKMLAAGDKGSARKLAEDAVASARDGSWYRWLDGAKKQVAYEALMEVCPDDGLARARQQFGSDLATGAYSTYYLNSDLPALFRFLQIPWPADSVVGALDEYLDEVLAAAPRADAFRSFTDQRAACGQAESICRFLIHLLAFPAADISNAARRAIAAYAREDGEALKAVLLGQVCWDTVQLEHILVALHVAAESSPGRLDGLKGYVTGLNTNESLGVRCIARRICETVGWHWKEVTDAPRPAKILLPGLTRLPARYAEGAQMMDGGVSVAAGLYGWAFQCLVESGCDLEALMSEFSWLYRDVAAGYSWSDDRRFKTWMKLALVRFWLHQRAILGREAALRMLGRHAMCGDMPPGAEQSYDLFFPTYDPDIEMAVARERPGEVTGMHWDFYRAEQEKGWFEGEGASSWDSYPAKIGALHMIGERTYMIRTDWHWPREERYRAMTATAQATEVDYEVTATESELTFQQYLAGSGQPDDAIVVWHGERQLMGPQYRWVAINSRIARQLGWVPSRTSPFEWTDKQGNLMVRSEYWKDGWIWIEPPRSDILGEGWYVVASDEAVRQILQAYPQAHMNLWVERHSNGEKPYLGKWHLQKPLMHLA